MWKNVDIINFYTYLYIQQPSYYLHMYMYVTKIKGSYLIWGLNTLPLRLVSWYLSSSCRPDWTYDPPLASVPWCQGRRRWALNRARWPGPSTTHPESLEPIAASPPTLWVDIGKERGREGEREREREREIEGGREGGREGRLKEEVKNIARKQKSTTRQLREVSKRQC